MLTRTPGITRLVIRGRLLLYDPDPDLSPSQMMWLCESNMILRHTSWFLAFKKIVRPANKAMVDLHLGQYIALITVTLSKVRVIWKSKNC